MAASIQLDEGTGIDANTLSPAKVEGSAYLITIGTDVYVTFCAGVDLGDDDEDLHLVDLGPVPAAQVTRPLRKSSKYLSCNPTIFDLFKPVCTLREVRLFWQLWHVHTRGKKTSWVRMATDWNQLIGMFPTPHAIHYYPKNAKSLETFMESYTSRLRGIDVSAFAHCMH